MRNSVWSKISTSLTPISNNTEESETGEPFNKKTSTADDYAICKNDLPDVKSINEYKHKKAFYQEIH